MNSGTATLEYSDDLESLLSNRIHLWVTPYMDCRLDKFLPCYRALLTDQERAREQRFHFQDDRRRFLITRALLRTTLSRYASVRAQDWCFEANAYGKPSVSHVSPLIRRVQFNLSHAHGLIVLAVCVDRVVGVDTESTERSIPHLELAVGNFAPYEAAAVQGATRCAQARRFIEYWTLKEAYVKARGQGLSIALDQFGFELHPSGFINMRFEGGGDSGANWHLWQWSFQENHLIALCTQTDRTQTVPCVKCRRILPFVSEDRLSLELLRSQ